MATNSTDLAGSFTVTTGTSPSTGVLATITFNTAFSTAPFVTITAANSNAPLIYSMTYINEGTTYFTVSTITASYPSTAYQFNYTVIQ
jgi:hypothetical protein